MERHSKSRSSKAQANSDAVSAELADGEVRLPPVVTERRKPREPHRDVYTIVTERIEAALEAGTIPWKKPWAAEGGMPRNLVSGKQYRGLNLLLLSLGQPYRSPWWLTFRQAEDLGGHIRKDEHSSIVTFWKFPKKQTDTDERPVKNKGEVDSDHFAPLLRYYNVFNLEQCEGIEAPPSAEFQPKQHERIELCETIVQGMPQPPAIRRDPRQAVYAPRLDCVYIPDLDQFETAEQYYGRSSMNSFIMPRPGLCRVNLNIFGVSS